jgi:hypothetical protein
MARLIKECLAGRMPNAQVVSHNVELAAEHVMLSSNGQNIRRQAFPDSEEG